MSWWRGWRRVLSDGYGYGQIGCNKIRFRNWIVESYIVGWLWSGFISLSTDVIIGCVDIVYIYILDWYGRGNRFWSMFLRRGFNNDQKLASAQNSDCKWSSEQELIEDERRVERNKW